MCGTLSTAFAKTTVLVTMVQRTTQVAYNVMVELNRLCFARPLTSKTMDAFKGYMLVYVANYICSRVLQQMHVSDSGP